MSDVSAECPDFESPLCGLSNVRSKLASYGAFVHEGRYNSVGPFENGLEQKDVIIGLASSGEESIWDSANLGCLACGKCLTVTREIDGHFVTIRDDLSFKRD